MKKVVGCFLILAMFGTAHAIPIPVDVNKSWVDDSNLCWLASGSNILEAKGWIESAQGFYNTMKLTVENKGNMTGYVFYDYFNSIGLKYHDMYAYMNYPTLNDVSSWIDELSVISLAMDYVAGGKHAVTVWSSDESGLWITDSDDRYTGLRYLVFNSTWSIYSIEALTEFGPYYVSADLPSQVNATPEPSTMLLFGSGLIGLAVVRRSLKKR